MPSVVNTKEYTHPNSSIGLVTAARAGIKTRLAVCQTWAKISCDNHYILNNLLVVNMRGPNELLKLKLKMMDLRFALKYSLITRLKVNLNSL